MAAAVVDEKDKKRFLELTRQKVWRIALSGRSLPQPLRSY
jgi:hypothetical protein